jgi:hypothetical protein
MGPWRSSFRARMWGHGRNFAPPRWGNAVNDFGSRIRENSGLWHYPQKSHDFGYVRLPRFHRSKNPSRRCPLGLAGPSWATPAPRPLAWAGMGPSLRDSETGRLALGPACACSHFATLRSRPTIPSPACRRRRQAGEGRNSEKKVLDLAHKRLVHRPDKLDWGLRRCHGLGCRFDLLGGIPEPQRKAWFAASPRPSCLRACHTIPVVNFVPTP